MGYAKAQSKPSLVAGVAFGAALITNGALMWHSAQWALVVPVALAGVLLFLMGMRFAKTRKFMPLGSHCAAESACLGADHAGGAEPVTTVVSLNRRRATKLMNKFVCKLVLFAFVPCAVIGCAHFGSPMAAGERSAKSTALRRNIRELRPTLIGKTTEEAVRTLGTPDGMYASGQREWWTYENRFYDPVTRINLQQVQLIFYKGKLEDIAFH